MSSPEKRPSLQKQLSLSTRSSLPLYPALRAALAQSHRHQPGGALASFAARAAIDPNNPEASLEMFRRLNQRRRER